MEPMERRQLVAALEDLAGLLHLQGTTARVYVVGGAAMVPAYDSERFTHDIDGLILDDRSTVTRAVHEVARRWGLPMSWLDEQASAYLPKGEDPGSKVVFDHPALRVTAASPERMLAMKVMSARLTDIPDIRLLVEIIGCSTPEEVWAITASVFPDQLPPERAKSAVAAVFSR